MCTSSCSTTAAPMSLPTRSAGRRCDAFAAPPASTSVRCTSAPAAMPTARSIPARSARSSPAAGRRHDAATDSLPYASSLCGACYEVCPVAIDIPEVLVHLRAQVVDAHRGRIPWAATITMKVPAPRSLRHQLSLAGVCRVGTASPGVSDSGQGLRLDRARDLRGAASVLGLVSVPTEAPMVTMTSTTTRSWRRSGRPCRYRAPRRSTIPHGSGRW